MAQLCNQVENVSSNLSHAGTQGGVGEATFNNVTITSAFSVHETKEIDAIAPANSNDGIAQKTIVVKEASEVPKTYLQKAAFWVADRDGHVWLMSLGFMLLFTAYPIQGVQTIRYPATGSYILIVLYSAYFATSMWSTTFLDRWGLEWCLPWGPISYGVWIACEMSGNTAANLVGAAFFGWGAGILWPAAGQLIATVSTPHRRATNSGIYMTAFNAGVALGGIILANVEHAFSSYTSQYAIFLGMCGASVIVFIVHAFTFRARYRNKKDIKNAIKDAHIESSIYRVQNDDGSVVYRKADRHDLQSEAAVVTDVALTGGRSEITSFTWSALRRRLAEPIRMLWHPVFGPLAPMVITTGGMTQGWWNASFNTIVFHAGPEWNGYIYSVMECFAIASAIAFGLFYESLRKNYIASRYRWPLYIYAVAYVGLCATALAAWYLTTMGIGNGPGQVSQSVFLGVISLVGACYGIQLLAVEVSMLTYLSTFFTYSADVAFSTKIACEAAGYLLVFGLVNVLSAEWMILLLFCASVPTISILLIFFKAPDRPQALLIDEVDAAVPFESSSLSAAQQLSRDCKSVDYSNTAENSKYSFHVNV